MPKKVGVGFCRNNDIVIVGDVVKNRFGLNNPWVVMEIYMVDNDYYIYHLGKGTEDIWLNCNDVGFVSHMSREYSILLTN